MPAESVRLQWKSKVLAHKLIDWIFCPILNYEVDSPTWLIPNLIDNFGGGDLIQPFCTSNESACNYRNCRRFFLKNYTISLNFTFKIFPLAVLGNSSINVIVFGHLKWANLSREKSISSCSVTIYPSRKTTEACGVSPHFSWGVAIIATS